MELLERGPVLAIPAAWSVTALSLSDMIDGMTFVPPMLVVMLAAQLFFLYQGWEDMDSGALRGWRLVIMAGVPFTLAGLAGIYYNRMLLSIISITYWLKAPGVGMAYTWQKGGSQLYLALGVLALVSGCLFEVLTLTNMQGLPFLLAGGAAHLAGIISAVRENSRK
jgi:hypothetical protein